MHIITDTDSARLIAVGTLKEYWPNGYPVITDTNGNDCAYPTSFSTMYEVAEIPDGVEPEKYCYTEADGFYANPNWIEPNKYGISDELVEQIKNDAIAEVEEAVINGTDTETA